MISCIHDIEDMQYRGYTMLYHGYAVSHIFHIKPEYRYKGRKVPS